MLGILIFRKRISEAVSARCLPSFCSVSFFDSLRCLTGCGRHFVVLSIAFGFVASTFLLLELEQSIGTFLAVPKIDFGVSV